MHAYIPGAAVAAGIKTKGRMRRTRKKKNVTNFLLVIAAFLIQNQNLQYPKNP